MKKIITVAFLFMSSVVYALEKLPEGYTQLKYIQGDGSTSRIVTDYTPNPQTDKIEAVVGWDEGEDFVKNNEAFNSIDFCFKHT